MLIGINNSYMCNNVFNKSFKGNSNGEVIIIPREEEEISQNNDKMSNDTWYPPYPPIYWYGSYYQPQINSNKVNDVKKTNELSQIDFQVKNPIILEKIKTAINNITNIEGNENLFNNKDGNKLIIKEGSFICKNSKKNMSDLYMVIPDSKNKTFQLILNNNLDWNDIDGFTKFYYNQSNIVSDDENFYLYKGLGEFLNFDDGEYDDETSIELSFSNVLKMLYMSSDSNTLININDIYQENKDGDYDKKVVLDNKCINDFVSSYFAAKMSKIDVPATVNTLYNACCGNMNVKFPNANSPKTKENELTFKTTLDAEKYLKQQYGINADFKKNLKFANDFTNAVKELNDIIDDNEKENYKKSGKKSIFDGLKVKTSRKAFNDRNGVAAFMTDDCTTIYIKEDKQNEIYKLINSSSLNCMLGAGNNVKNEIFIHELSHYLDKINEKPDGKNMLTIDGLKIASKVSAYATHDANEFCAEYVSGRMSDKKYPLIADIIFQQNWNGPKLNFPD